MAYTQPAAFFGYFAAGCLVAELYLRHSARLKGRAVFILLAAAALIPFALVRPETARDILVGGTGVTLMACTIVLITATAFISEPSGRLRQPAYWLGRLSYPIYLYHPVVYWALALAKVGGPGLRISLTLALTLALSYLTNVLVEEPCRRFGQRLAAGLRSRDDQIPVGDARTANPAPKA